MKLIHLANHSSTNIGNGALIFGTERVLREDFDEDVTFLPEAWDDYVIEDIRGPKEFDASFVEMVNQESDGLLIGGAVTLNGRAHLMNTGMRFNLPLELWSRITKPIVFYGITYRVWPYQIYYNQAQLKKTMEYVLSDSNIIFSVRNDGTKAWLERFLGYTSDKIVCIPDPGLYVTCDHGAWHPQITKDKVNVIVSLNNEDEIYRFGGKWRETFWKYVRSFSREEYLAALWYYMPGWRKRKKEFLQQLVQALELISKQVDTNIILCPHSLDDYKIMSEFMSHCPLRLAHQRVVSSGLLQAPLAPYFYGLYANADLALSMRVHSMSPAIALGTPVIVLSSQARTKEFMKAAGMEKYVLDVFDNDLAAKLYGLMKYCFDHRENVKASLRQALSTMREQTFTFNRQIYSFIKAKK